MRTDFIVKLQHINTILELSTLVMAFQFGPFLTVAGAVLFLGGLSYCVFLEFLLQTQVCQNQSQAFNSLQLIFYSFNWLVKIQLSTNYSGKYNNLNSCINYSYIIITVKCNG